MNTFRFECGGFFLVQLCPLFCVAGLCMSCYLCEAYCGSSFPYHFSLTQDTYESFSKLDSKGMCYRFEVSLCGPAIELHNCMAKLLCHPLQRPFQSHASYSLLEGDEPPEIEATV